jgi:hypothetical protein
MDLILFFNKVIASICSSDGKKLLTNRIRNMASLAASHAAMYSVSVNDRATYCYRFELYETGESYIMNIYPVINFLIIRLSFQSESIYLCNSRSPFQ